MNPIYEEIISNNENRDGILEDIIDLQNEILRYQIKLIRALEQEVNDLRIQIAKSGS